MTEWLISLVPWWAWLLLAAAAVGAVWRIWGWQGAVAAAGAAIAVLTYGKGRAEGSAAERAKVDRRNLEAAEDRKEIDDEVDQLGTADVDRRFDKWMRDDDAG